MVDETLPAAATEVPTPSACLQISLWPAAGHVHAGDPTACASIRINLREAEFNGPGSETRSLLIAATTVAGLLSAGATAGLASSDASQAPWFLGLAVIELVLTYVVVLKIAQRDRETRSG
jgi:hypothetical protein